MPVLLGQTMQSMLRPGLTTSVYIGKDELVYKKGPRVALEAKMLHRVEKLLPRVCPKVFACEGDVLCMAAGSDVRGVLNEVDVAVLASQLFWHVYQVHECGLVHGDIKPGNVLRMSATPQQYVLCDWDSAAEWKDGVAVTTRCTAGFCETGCLTCKTLEDFDRKIYSAMNDIFKFNNLRYWNNLYIHCNTFFVQIICIVKFTSMYVQICGICKRHIF